MLAHPHKGKIREVANVYFTNNIGHPVCVGDTTVSFIQRQTLFLSCHFLMSVSCSWERGIYKGQVSTCLVSFSLFEGVTQETDSFVDSQHWCVSCFFNLCFHLYVCGSSYAIPFLGAWESPWQYEFSLFCLFCFIGMVPKVLPSNCFNCYAVVSFPPLSFT